MVELKTMYCEACQEGVSPITQSEINEFMPLIPGWRVVKHDGVRVKGEMLLRAGVTGS